MKSEFSLATNQKIKETIDQELQKKTFPGIEILVAVKDRILFHEAFGRFDQSPESQSLVRDSVFDLASLTKPLATAVGIISLMEDNALNRDATLAEFFPELSGTEKAKITISQLLTHSSGLPAWEALYLPNFDKSEGWKQLFSMELTSPPGTQVLYSCLGYIFLGEIIRRTSKLSLTRFCEQRLFKPAFFPHMGFNPKQTDRLIVPTAFCPYRQKLLRGTVHDENAYLFDGEGGNAGLFGCASEIHQYCLSFLTPTKTGALAILFEESSHRLLEVQTKPPLAPRTYGWDYNAGNVGYMSCGDLMPQGSVGHLGFTGTSIWMDPKSGLIVIVLSNRVNISREKNLPQIKAFRPAIHNLLLRDII